MFDIKRRTKMAEKAIKYSANSLDFAQKVAGFSAKAVEIKAPFSGRPEAHRNQHDLYVVISGKAKVKTGELTGKVDEISEGEYRSDEMIVDEEHTLQIGESLLIPAGVAHTVIVESGLFAQWVFKIDKR
jgi:mannose-6-phosphate isomerase-like protein (cupin superfamily)